MTLCNLQIHWLYISFTSLPLLNSLFFHYSWKPAKQMCQNDLPNKCAKMTRRKVLPWKSARSTRENNPPNLLARDPPFPAQNPQAEHGSPTFPPPHSSANGAGGGGGQGVDPARLCTSNRYFSFSFSHLMNGYIFLYNTIHKYSTQSGLNEYKYIAVGEGIIARRGWGAGLLPAPLKGVFCII